MLKIFANTILQHQTKSLFCDYTTMVSYLFVNGGGGEELEFKRKNSEIQKKIIVFWKYIFRLEFN